MTRRELVESVSESTGIPAKDVEAVIVASMDEIKDRMIAGDTIVLRGFGVFSVVKQKEREAFDFAKKKLITIPERNVPKFKFSKRLTDEVIENN